jgi:hypothetical protein
MTLAHSSALSGKPFVGCSKFPTYIYYSAHEILIAAQSRQAHTGSFIKHRSTTSSFSPPPAPLAPLAFADLSPPQPCSSPAPPRPAWQWWRGRDYWHADVRPANLKALDTDPSLSSPTTTTSRLPQPWADVDPAPPIITRTTTSFATEVSLAWTPNSLIGHQNLLYILVNVD